MQGNALLYSINKDKADLDDSYLDLLIARFLDKVVEDYRKQRFEGDSNCSDIKGRDNIDGILRFLFDFDNLSRDNLVRYKTEQQKDYFLNNLCRLVCEGVINYNPRTNSLHFMRNFPGDDHKNLVATRRKESIAGYVDELHEDGNVLLSSCTEGVAGDFVKELINLRMNPHSSSENDNRKSSAMASYRAIENDIYERYYSGVEAKPNDKDGVGRTIQPYDCVVIDGFSQLGDRDLSEISYLQLTECLRKLSKISILVFDDRDGFRCDGDIVIEMKEEYNNEESYMYHSLRIAKCIFQTAILGWHQYKKRDFGIQVFPSQHMHLSKRFYIQNKTKHIGQSMFESGITEYFDSKNYRECLYGYIDECPSRKSFAKFVENQAKMADYLHDKVYREYAESINLLSEKIELDKKGRDNERETVKEILQDVLCFKFPEETKERVCCVDKSSSQECGRDDLIWTDHFPCTVIIGNPNSYKRTFALATAHKLACLQKPIHTLFFLFDKNELDMRTRMVCPAFYGNDLDNRIIQCRKCNRYIHTYNMRMGCISPNEFFDILQEQINFYCKTSECTGNEQSWMHIVIDDIQKIQFSFPFLRDTNLFLSALLEICRQNKVKLTILCDKNSELTREVSSIADNVIDIRRDEDDIYRVEFNIERRIREKIPSRIVQLDIRDILHLFRCNCRDMHISFSTEEDTIVENGIETKDGSTANYHKFFGPNYRSQYTDEPKDVYYRVHPKIIGSMKGYWRKTENVIPRK